MTQERPMVDMPSSRGPFLSMRYTKCRWPIELYGITSGAWQITRSEMEYPAAKYSQLYSSLLMSVPTLLDTANRASHEGMHGEYVSGCAKGI